NMLLEFALSLSFYCCCCCCFCRSGSGSCGSQAAGLRQDPAAAISRQLPAFFAKALRFGRRFRFHLYLQGLSRRFGPVTAFRLGTQRFVLISGHAALREALIGRGDAFGYRMDTPFFRYLSRKRGLAMSDGPLWAEHRRRFAVRAFRRLGLGGPQAEALIEAECRSLLDALADALDGRASAEVDASDLITRAIVNVISQLLFSTRADYSDSELSEYVSHLSTLTHGDFVTLLITCYPWLPIRLCWPCRPGLELWTAATTGFWSSCAPEWRLSGPAGWIRTSGRTRTASRPTMSRPTCWSSSDSSGRPAALAPSTTTSCTAPLTTSTWAAPRHPQTACAGCCSWPPAPRHAASLPPGGGRRHRHRLEASQHGRQREAAVTRAFIEETLRLVVPLPLGVNSRVVRATEVLAAP
ncbi:hypothetical protein BOX15_Mlig012961g1, partial [Macrostomum lignano]